MTEAEITARIKFLRERTLLLTGSLGWPGAWLLADCLRLAAASAREEAARLAAREGRPDLARKIRAA